MSLLNDIGKKIGEVAEDAADKAKDMAEIAKLKAEIALERKKIKQGYIKLGELYFEQIKDTNQMPEMEICEKIKESMLTIADLEFIIEDIKY